MGDHDDNGTTQAPAQVDVASNMATTKFGHEPANPGEDMCSPAGQEENHENVRVVVATQNQHAAQGRGGSQDHDQIRTENYGKGGHPKRANEKLGKKFERTNQKQGKDIERTNQKPITTLLGCCVGCCCCFVVVSDVVVVRLLLCRLLCRLLLLFHCCVGCCCCCVGCC